MILRNINHKYSYNAEKICTIFFPLEKIYSDGESEIIVETEIKNDDAIVRAKLFSESYSKKQTVSENDDPAYVISFLLYKVLSQLTGFKPPWGILYGVRPARLMHATAEKIGEDAAREKFIKYNLVSPKKTSLAIEVMKRENKIIALSDKNSYSLYVSIPFCPSRCSYCSFVSHSVERASDLINPYVDFLCKELRKNAEIADLLNLKLETVYFGGGTPTALSANQLSKILSVINECFDLTALREYTVESGRPDTVTEEKLEVLKKYEVTRISINPQTFNDKVLEKIGRRHNSEQTVKAYELARNNGFNNINMDLIAGLNSDTLQSFKNSIDTAVSLKPQSITVHNLALKSGAYLVTNNENYNLSDKTIAAKMIDYSYEKLSESNYYPYYMYRQSKSLGNLENVGWCKDGFDCLYNVYMMDETHTVLSAGAGAVTKLKNQESGYIQRIYNYKYPYEYINDFDEILLRKKRIIDFYKA